MYVSVRMCMCIIYMFYAKVTRSAAAVLAHLCSATTFDQTLAMRAVLVASLDCCKEDMKHE